MSNFLLFLIYFVIVSQLLKKQGYERSYVFIFSGVLSNLIISLSTMVLKIVILMFDKISMSELGCCMDDMDMIFKLATFPSLMSFFPQAISGFKNS